MVARVRPQLPVEVLPPTTISDDAIGIVSLEISQACFGHLWAAVGNHHRQRDGGEAMTTAATFTTEFAAAYVALHALAFVVDLAIRRH